MSDEYRDFSKHPTSLGERRANGGKGNATLWTPREALVAALRAIDLGEIRPDQCAIVLTEDEDEGETGYHFFQACKSTNELIGIYNTAIHHTLKR